MPKGAKLTNCTSCRKLMKTVRADLKATCIPCRHAAQELKPGESPCSLSGCRYPKRFKTGYCHTHHRRFIKHGDPNVTLKGKAHAVGYTEDGLRICTKCSTPKPDSEFHRDKGGSNGRRAKCADCEATLERERYLREAEKIKERQREYRKMNLEAVRLQEKANYERNRDARVESAVKHAHIRRARLAELEYEKGITVTALRKRHGDNCQYCNAALDFKAGKRGAINPRRASIEHVRPISKGGTHTWDNVTLICHQCNTSKNAKTLDEWKPSDVLDREHTMVGQLALFPFSYALSA